MTHNLNKDPIQETQGDTFSRDINFTDTDDNAIDITGWILYVTVKRDLTDVDSDAALSADVTSHDDATAGQTSFSFPPSETDELDGAYHFEIKYKDDNDDVETVLRRRIEFNEAVRKTI